MKSTSLTTLLQRPVDELARRVLGWWLGELAGRGRARWRGGAKPLVVKAGAAGLRFSRGGQTWWPGRPAELQVPTEWLLCPTLRLPEAAQENLAAVVAADLDRVTPFAAEAVLHLIGPIRPDGRDLLVEVAVLPRRLVEPPVAHLADNGIAVARIAAADGGPDWLAGRNFLAVSGLPMPAGPSRPVLALLLLALLAPLLGSSWQMGRVREHLPAAQAAAAQAMRLSREMALRRAGLSDIAAERVAAGSVSRVLVDLSVALPEAAWLEAVTVEGAQVVVSGRGEGAAVAAALLAGGRFAEARPAPLPAVGEGAPPSGPRFALALAHVPATTAEGP